MMTLLGFGSAFSLPDVSPFVMKVQVLLKMANLPYVNQPALSMNAPKGKLPVLIDGDETITDSTFIRLHLESKYHLGFDAHLDPQQRASLWALEKLLEDHLYWLLLWDRWLDDVVFEKGAARLFDRVPEHIRADVMSQTREHFRTQIGAQGTGRHSDTERVALAERAFAAIDGMLGDSQWFGQEKACGVDATAAGFLIWVFCPALDSPIKAAAEKFPRLKAYEERARRIFFA